MRYQANGVKERCDEADKPPAHDQRGRERQLDRDDRNAADDQGSDHHRGPEQVRGDPGVREEPHDRRRQERDEQREDEPARLRDGDAVARHAPQQAAIEPDNVQDGAELG
jgi:hypothetical protein